MNISNLISTFIFIIVISTIYLFAMIFYLYSNADSANLTLLKDAFSTTSGFLSGIATLGTAYVAAKLFNDWKIQHNKQLSNDFNIKIYEQFIHLDNLILEYGLLTIELEPPKIQIRMPFSKKHINLYLDKYENIIRKSEEIDFAFSYFLDRARECSIVTSRESEILPRLKEYHSIFEEIINTTPNIKSIEDIIDSKKLTYEKYIALRDKINQEIIAKLLADLKATNN